VDDLDGDPEKELQGERSESESHVVVTELVHDSVGGSSGGGSSGSSRRVRARGNLNTCMWLTCMNALKPMCWPPKWQNWYVKLRHHSLRMSMHPCWREPMIR
jgi:hypothetical protein